MRFLLCFCLFVGLSASVLAQEIGRPRHVNTRSECFPSCRRNTFTAVALSGTAIHGPAHRPVLPQSIPEGQRADYQQKPEQKDRNERDRSENDCPRMRDQRAAPPFAALTQPCEVRRRDEIAGRNAPDV